MGFFENWDKSSQKKWDKGVAKIAVDFFGFVLVYYLRFRELGDKVA